jgi:hypothetical protein
MSKVALLLKEVDDSQKNHETRDDLNNGDGVSFVDSMIMSEDVDV